MPLLKIKETFVKIETIDSICEKYHFKPDFLKIDVEGSELEVLKGATNTLKNINSIMIEISVDHNLIFNILKRNNFYPVDNNAKIIEWEKIYAIIKIIFKKDLLDLD